MDPQILSAVAAVLIVLAGLIGSAWHSRRAVTAAVTAAVAALVEDVKGEVAARSAEVGLVVASQAGSLRQRVDQLERELYAALAKQPPPASSSRRLLSRHPTDES